MERIQGLHHITAIASDPQKNVDFYHKVLGQRLVKTTVNFDDPGTYHLYYGDKVGSPGTIMTFFPWKGMRRGKVGNGETAATGYTIPTGAVEYWRERLNHFGVLVKDDETRFGDAVLSFVDPDGMGLELIANDEKGSIDFWDNGPVPQDMALRGFHSVTLWVGTKEPTAKILTEVMGYEEVGTEGNRSRYKGASDDIGLYIDIVERPGHGQGTTGAGTVHHIAFRTVDDSEQEEYRQKIAKAGYNVTTVRDRQYFHSIYFREPNGVLFEVATDAPGFSYDEPVEELGTNLKLPDWYEPQREMIEARLPKFNIPTFEPEA
ncbi:MAG: ring-cleaving dioxygenase [Chloroflexota bacterium]